MTDLVAPSWMGTKRADAVEHWHATVMREGLIASVVVACEADGRWTARTQLLDRSLQRRGDCRKSGRFDTHEAALHAGQAAALRLHKATVGTHKVPEPARTIALLQPVGGYQSQTLRRFARVQQDPQTMRSPTVAPQRESEAEMIA
ncbi:MAG TPA: hypothetical protein VK660_07550 [Xanthomonadaceae bacterium]|jgi:hypothetical protein|nr:hypothetical protein [Xanthomonadaceae bacterium]